MGTCFFYGLSYVYTNTPTYLLLKVFLASIAYTGDIFKMGRGIMCFNECKINLLRNLSSIGAVMHKGFGHLENI